MRNIFRLLFLTIAFSAAQHAVGANVVWFDGHNHVSYIAHQFHSPLVKIALDLFAEDMKAVTGHRAVENHKGKIEIIELNSLSNKEFKKIQKRKLQQEENQLNRIKGEIKLYHLKKEKVYQNLVKILQILK